MKKKINQIFRIIVFLILSGLLLYLAFRKVELDKIVEALKTAKYSWLILSVTFSIFAFISRARRWILMIRPLGYNPGLKNTYNALMTGYLINFGLPRVGEFSRCVALGKKEKIPVDKLFGTVIAERAIDLLSLFIILFVMVLLKSELMGSFLKNDVFIPIKNKIISIFGFSALFIITVIVIIAFLAYLIFFFRERLIKINIIKKIAGFIYGVLNGLKSFIKMKDKAEFIFHTLFIWLNYTLMSWVIVFMIPATSHLALADGTFLLVLGSLGMAAPVQGGIGAFHWIVSRGMYAVYNISIEDGLVYATIAHESQLILIAVLGTISIYFIFRKTGKSKTDLLTDKPNG